MLSEGKIGVDNVYSLREGMTQDLDVKVKLTCSLGVLTLHLNKESYERAGIVGQPEGVKGKRGTKPLCGTFLWIVNRNYLLT
jgi:ribonuclease P/MRP protein subunit RPP40